MIERFTRVIRHRWANESGAQVPIDAAERLMQRVSASEKRHSGEIRICIEAGLPNSYLLRPGALPLITRQRALAQFGKLHVWDTAHNNGVLIYLLLAERAIELVADRGLNQQVGPAVWQGIVHTLAAGLREGKFEEALALAVDAVSALLVAHFPLTEGALHDNELPDAPTFL